MSAVPDILKAFNRAKGGEDVDLRFMTLLPAELEVALKQLSSSEDFKQLWLHRCCIGDRGCQTLVQFASRCRNLTSLSLSDNQISNTGAAVLLAAIADNKFPNLEYISFRNNDIRGRDIGEALALAICPPKDSEYPGLINLSLEDNSISNTGLKPICDVLSSPRVRLQSLALTSTRITSNGLQQLSDVLKDTTTLEEILLSGNAFSPEAISALRAAIKENKTVHALTLPRQQHSDDGDRWEHARVTYA